MIVMCNAMSLGVNGVNFFITVCYITMKWRVYSHMISTFPFHFLNGQAGEIFRTVSPSLISLWAMTYCPWYVKSINSLQQAMYTIEMMYYVSDISGLLIVLLNIKTFLTYTENVLKSYLIIIVSLYIYWKVNIILKNICRTKIIVLEVTRHNSSHRW